MTSIERSGGAFNALVAYDDELVSPGWRNWIKTCSRSRRRVYASVIMVSVNERISVHISLTPPLAAIHRCADSFFYQLTRRERQGGTRLTGVLTG